MRIKTNRMLKRREVENYLFDKEILKKYCFEKHFIFDEKRYDGVVSNITDQDMKPIQQNIQSCCCASGSSNIVEFKKRLAKLISKDTTVFRELHDAIF